MKKAGKKLKRQTKKEVCELNIRIWGVIDGVSSLASKVTYKEASEIVQRSEKGIIVTATVASKLPKSH